jgi:DHA1 family multidrug resistance protein-like MFS transporter
MRCVFCYFFCTRPLYFLIVRIFQGLLAGFVPASIALIATNTPEKEVGYALSVMSTASAAGSVIGPLIGGLVSHLIGNRESFLLSGIVVLVAAFIGLVGVKEGHFNRSAERSGVLNDLKSAAHNRQLMTILAITMLIATSVMILEPLITLYVIFLSACLVVELGTCFNWAHIIYSNIKDHKGDYRDYLVWSFMNL